MKPGRKAEKTSGRTRISTTVTIGDELMARVNRLVDAGKASNVSRVFEECLLGYLIVLEAEAGHEYRQKERRFTFYQQFRRFVTAISDPDILGEGLLFAMERHGVIKQMKRLIEDVEELPKAQDDHPPITTMKQQG